MTNIIDPDEFVPKDVLLDPEYVPETASEWAQLWNATKNHLVAQRAVDQDRTYIKKDWGQGYHGLALPSDFHIGSSYCDMEQLESDMTYLGDFRKAYPGVLHLGHLGDPIDGYIPAVHGGSGTLEEVETRLDRQEGMFLYVADKAGPWEVLLLGCHEAWSLTRAGRDPITPLARVLGAANGGYGVLLEAKVGEQTYRAVLRHKAKRESAINTTNAQRAIDDEMGLNDEGSRADIIALSHLHRNDLQVKSKAGRRVIYSRSGSYKGGDGYARAEGYVLHKGADTGFPVFIFNPETHDVEAFDGRHWKTGLDVLAARASKE